MDLQWRLEQKNVLFDRLYNLSVVVVGFLNTDPEALQRRAGVCGLQVQL